ncbi:Protoglobin-domain-containing protein [Cladochytrium replicatum]|nr:Protoglobin-domain-containing protein [Cladochytrium replicatum]
MSTNAAPSTSAPRHVEREKLYTDAMYRHQYVTAFIDFGEADVAAIKASAKYIGPLLPAIVDAVYDRLFAFDITKAHFTKKQNEQFDATENRDKIVDDLSKLNLEADAVAIRKGHLTRYLKKLVTADYADPAFFAYLDRVGWIHLKNPAKKSTINVEYVHINALFGWLHGFVASTVAKIDEIDNETKAAVLGAWSKLLWIQNDLFAKYYVRDGEEIPDSVSAKAAAAFHSGDAVNSHSIPEKPKTMVGSLLGSFWGSSA